MKTNSRGLALIKAWEGCKLEAYRDAVGVWTIGYGHTWAAGNPRPAQGMKITQARAEEILIVDLIQYERAVINALTTEPNENQFAAMVSLCFNIGPGNFSKSSVVRYWNAGMPDKAAAAFLLWNKAGGKILKGLANRRAAEIKLFNKPVEPFARNADVRTDKHEPRFAQPVPPIPDLPDPIIEEPPVRPSLWQWIAGIFRRA